MWGLPLPDQENLFFHGVHTEVLTPRCKSTNRKRINVYKHLTCLVLCKHERQANGSTT